MWQKKSTIALASLGVAGVVALGSQSLAQAATSSTTAPSTATSSTTAPSTTTSSTTAPSTTAPGEAVPNHTPGTAVTGAELDKVKAAVVAKDAAVTVMTVTKEADGSYDAFGTKAGANVVFEVSTDLATITQNTNAGRGGHGDGGPGAGGNTPVTGAEADKVSAAVKAKETAVTVTSVRQDPDGSYDVLGTKAGADVFYDVSKDLTTVTLNAGPAGHGFGGPGHESAGPGA